jgi:DNA polymerase-3 subunit gamma/tau
VYIIDEAHMLTGAAFNALLKTLEEPPRHAVLILATTEFEKLPPTITSRAQRFLFKKLTKATIIGKLASIAKKEKIKIDEPAIELIAAAAEGSFRDAESLLDQISSLGAAAEGIALADVECVTGRTGLRKVHEFAACIVARDIKGALANLNDLNEGGHNLVQFTKDLIHYLRKVLSLKINPSLKPVMERDLTKDEVAGAVALGATADTAILVKIIKALIRAYAEMRYSPFAIVPLEVALVEQLT